VLGAIALAGWSAVAALGLLLARMWRDESRADRVIGLLYHRVVPRELYDGFTGTEQIFSLPADRFREQLTWLEQHGYTFVSLDQLADALHGGEPLPENAVCITFDDGCESVYKNALPILRDLGIPSGVFVTTDADAWIFHEGEYYERRMSEDELCACHEGGITIGSHAITHRGLNEMSREAVLAELEGSRELLERWIGAPVEHFAVPLNFYNRTTLELCRQAGYRSVCTSDNGTSHAGTSPYKIKRFIVEGSYDLGDFERSLTPRFILQRRILNSLKKLPPKLLGERLWMPLRERIFRGPIGRYLTFRHLRVALALGVATAGLALVAVTLLALV
jgi:peptidoglycan/xylan/chitin deacetylase (PgdA/CDA1 family)